MCIILTRHFRCSDTVVHVCAYLLRCSNPTFTVEDAVRPHQWAERPCLALGELEREEEWYDEPCLALGELEREEEWYDEPCPNCTGEIDIPKTKPVRIQSSAPATDIETVFANHDLIFQDKIAVSEYARNLAYLLLSYLYSPETGFGERYPKPEDAEEAEIMRKKRQVCLLNELTCHIHPEHGSPWRLARTGRYVEETEEVEVTGWTFRTPAYGCECLSTQNPWLSNWALHIRRSIASDVYSQILDPDRNHPELSEDELQQAHATQKRFMANYKKLAKVNTGQRPILEVLRTTKEWRHERYDALKNDGIQLLARCQWDVAELEDAEEEKRLEARAGLVVWVAFLLALDSGLTLERARVILALFMAKMVAYDPHWQDFDERSSDSDPFKRLAHAANKHPVGVPEWVTETLDAFKSAEFSESLHNYCTLWERQDRERAAVVHRNIVRADEADVAEMKESDDAACAICLEPFEEHDTALSRLPVQNWRCHRAGHKHWCGHPCLVRFARTLQGPSLVAPEPRCPMCRTMFEDPKPEEAAMVENGRLAVFVFEDEDEDEDEE